MTIEERYCPECGLDSASVSHVLIGSEAANLYWHAEPSDCFVTCWDSNGHIYND